MRYKVVAIHIDGGQDQTGHEDHQAERQAAKPVEGRLFGAQRQHQLILILEERKRKSRDGLMRDLSHILPNLDFPQGLFNSPGPPAWSS